MTRNPYQTVLVQRCVADVMFRQQSKQAFACDGPDLLCAALSVQLLYATFLRDFFAADEIDDELFLMEMRDGGFLGDGSEEF